MSLNQPIKTSGITTSSHWYLAAAKPKQELRAVEHLKNQDIEGFCPLIKIEKIVRGKKKVIEEPMFTGYLFIHISMDDPLWSKVRSTRGVRDWIRFAGNIGKIPNKLIESLQASQNNIEQEIVVNRFIKGDSVRVLSGAFAGLKGIFEQESGESRSMVLIEFLGQSSRVLLPSGEITTN